MSLMKSNILQLKETGYISGREVSYIRVPYGKKFRLQFPICGFLLYFSNVGEAQLWILALCITEQLKLGLQKNTVKSSQVSLPPFFNGIDNYARAGLTFV